LLLEMNDVDEPETKRYVPILKDRVWLMRESKVMPYRWYADTLCSGQREQGP
jgi:hypothetical protein